MQAREMFSEKSSGASHAVKIERAEDNQTCKAARAWEGLGRDIVSSSGARLAGCVCGGGWSVRWSGSSYQEAGHDE